MSGLQLMIPPFVACMVLVAMLSYLGLHVIAREVIFVDLSLAQMAALGGLSALLIHVEADSTWAYVFALFATAVGALLFALTLSCGARGGWADGLQLAGRPGCDRVPLYPRHAAPDLHLVGLGGARVDPGPVAVARG